MTDGDSQAVTVPPAAEQGRVERGRHRRTARRPSRGCWTRAPGATSASSRSSSCCASSGWSTADTFATTSNLLTILSSASIIGVITVGVTFVIIGGGIDLSVGKVMALASVWATTLATQVVRAGVMVFCALLVGAGCGLVNGLLIAYGRIVPFIATLAMLVSAQGPRRADLGQAQPVGQRARDHRRDRDHPGARHPAAGLHLRVVVVVGWVVLNRTTFGRRTFAVGGNPEAARLAGIHVRRHTVLLYVISGFCCGIAAVLIHR